MPERDRTAAGRAVAELALVRLLHAIGDAQVSPIVLGGLVPALLTRGRPATAPAHLGTADVDVLVISHLEEASGLADVERALDDLDFGPVDADGWRWRGRVGGHPVVVEFLCDLDTARQAELVRLDAGRLAALNLRGTGYVALDFSLERLAGTTAGGEPVTVTARFAGLAGYLLSKCAAIRGRAFPRDYYDFAYVLLYNSLGGPAPAARLLREERFASARRALASTLFEVRERFRGTTDAGPTRFAEEVLRGDPSADAAALRADAVAAVAEFFAALDA